MNRTKTTRHLGTLLTTGVFLFSGACAWAAEYYLVVPAPGRLPTIAVNLESHTLPAGYAGEPYAGMDFKTLLSITGDAAYNPSSVAWSQPAGVLPSGMTLSADGVLTGTPAVGSPASSDFTLKADYKNLVAQQTYGLVINPGRVVGVPRAAPFAIHGKTPLNVTSIRRYVFRNNTASAVNVTSLASSNNAFGLDSNNCEVGLSLAAGSYCDVYVLFKPSLVSQPLGQLNIGSSGGSASAPLSGEGFAPVWSNTLKMNGAYQANSSTNWNTMWRLEISVDKSAGVMVADGYFTAWGSGGVPQGSYGLNLTGTGGSTFVYRKIVTRPTNERVSIVMPLIAGSYKFASVDGLELAFSVNAAGAISGQALTLNAAPLAVSMTLVNN